MSQFVSALDSMRQEFGVTVLLVTRKRRKQGPRGSTPCDSSGQRDFGDSQGSWACSMQHQMKDAEPFRPMAFQLVAVNLQDDQGRELADDYGQPVTSVC